MKMIKPIVNLSKIIDDFEVVVFGLCGTVFDGENFCDGINECFESLYKANKRIVLISNTSKRVFEVLNIFKQNNINLGCFYSVVTAGEILHHKLKAKSKVFASLGEKYYAIAKEDNVFEGLDYSQVFDISKADFLYVGQDFSFNTTLELYKPDLSYAVSLSMPLICAGNNASNYKKGVLSIDSGAFAEQYATLGGSILTIGKPDANILAYALDGLSVSKEKVLVIGNNIQTDIKMADLYGCSSVLVSKGVHKHFLGEGYIPDVAKARELAVNYNTYPDFVISNIRF